MDQEEPLGGHPMPPAANEVARPSVDDASPLADAGATEPPPPLAIEQEVLSTAPAGPPPFTVRGLVRDTFARYGSDMIRLFGFGLVAGIFNFGLGVFRISFTSYPPPPDTEPTPLAFVFGIFWTPILMALVGGGRSGSIATALRTGFRRTFRAFLALLATGLTVVAIVAAIAFPARLFLRGLNPLDDIVTGVALVIGFWVAARLYLALAGVVVDGLGASDALSLSWRITKPWRV